jgi:2,3-bisphosphoglycerate-independent phosphoglycerate mutase
MGLLSSGGVHSHDHHMLALAHLLNQEGIPTFIHAFLDGRDTAPTSGYTYLEALLHNLEQHPSIRLATVSGRFFAMDRDQRWERTQKAYEAIVQAKAPLVNDILQHVTQSYEQGITDEFIPPIRLAGFSGMRDGDGLFMINFRADRVRQLLRALLLPQFNDFARSRVIRFAAQLGMTEYADDLSAVLPALFPPVAITKSLGEIVSDAGLRQLRLAETEKYAHVTFFFNGGRETPFAGEERCLVPSPRVQTYDLQPEMAAFAITDQLLNALSSQRYDFIVVNYANADMVGHTGHLTASIRAVEVLDTCLGQLIDALQKQGGLLVVTADHGNIEMLVDPHSQQMHTAHTLNLVPFVIYTPTAKAFTLAKSGTLADIAPTLLELMGLPLPTEMTGRSLLRP